jgi:FkbM family methyltransferase
MNASCDDLMSQHILLLAPTCFSVLKMALARRNLMEKRYWKLLTLIIGLSFLILDLFVRRGTRGTAVSESKLEKNANEIKQIRQKFLQECQDSTTTKDELQRLINSWFDVSSRRSASVPIQPCRFTILDFGANVGDSLAKFIDVGLPACPAKGIESVKYNTTSHHAQSSDTKPNKFTSWVSKMMQEGTKQQHREPFQPEDYCYYGIEGNPVFTKRLRALETAIWNSRPRPVRSARFFTETIATDTNGPATLYLDTQNADQNYWGSSVYASHKDVQASAATSPNGQLVTASVTGITLTSMIVQTVIRKPGSHLIIKMDIEGAEYAVLNEAYDSGILCKYAEHAVRIDILVEAHPSSVVGKSNDALIHWREKVHPELKFCGVHVVPVSDAGR